MNEKVTGGSGRCLEWTALMWTLGIISNEIGLLDDVNAKPKICTSGFLSYEPLKLIKRYLYMVNVMIYIHGPLESQFLPNQYEYLTLLYTCRDVFSVWALLLKRSCIHCVSSVLGVNWAGMQSFSRNAVPARLLNPPQPRKHDQASICAFLYGYFSRFVVC